MTLAAWVLASFVLWAGGTWTLDPAGATRWEDAAARAEAPWRVELAPAAADGWVLVELDGRGPFVDLDLRIRGAEGERAATSHLPRERMLVPVRAGEGLQLTVAVAPMERRREGAFRLGVTALSVAGAVELGASTRFDLEPVGRARLYQLELPADAVGELLRVQLDRLAGVGDVDLLVFDADCGPAAIAEVRPDGELALLEAWDLSSAPGAAPARTQVLRVIPRVHGGSASVRLLTERHGAVGSGAGHGLRPFLERLGGSPSQRLALRALRQAPDFLRIDAYLTRYPQAAPVQLEVVPGLTAHGVERFGTYSQGVLTINPSIEGHRENVQELIDTLIHELVHALLALPRAPGFPLAPDVLDSSHDARLSPLSGLPLRRGRVPAPLSEYLEAEYGPSASNPGEDFTDINAGAQRLVIKVVQENIERTGLGRQTLVFANARQRADAVK